MSYGRRLRESLSGLILRVPDHPYLIILIVVLITAFFAYNLRNLKMQPDISAALPNWVPAKKAYDLMGRLFPSRDFMLVVVKSKNRVFEKQFLEDVKVLTENIKDIPAVYSAVSISTAPVIQEKGDVISVKPLIEAAPPEGPEGIKRFRKIFMEKVFMHENLVSRDEVYAGVMVFFRKGVKPEKGAEAVIKGVNKFVRGRYWTGTAGRPVIDYHLSRGMARDMGMLTTLAVIVAFTVLYYTFRNFRGVLLPFLVVVFTNVWTLGTMVVIGHSLSHSTNIMPILLFSIGLADSVHLLSRYFKSLAEGMGNHQAVKKSLRELDMPVIFTSLTTAAGFLALLSSGIRSLGELAVFTALGVMYALFITLTLLPAGLVLLGRPRKLAEVRKPKSVTAIWLFRAVTERRSHVILVFMVLFAILFAGFFRLNAEYNTLDNFRKNSPLRKVIELINDKFAGSVSLSIMVSTGEEGGALNPQVVRKIFRFEKFLKSLPHINEVFSYADVIALMHRVFMPEEARESPLPGPVVKIRDAELSTSEEVSGKDVIAQYIELYELSGRGEELAATLDYRRKSVRILAFLDTEARSVLTPLRKRINNYIIHNLKGLKPLLDGMSEVVLAVNDLVVKGQAFSLTVSLFSVFLLILILLRSFKYSFLGIIPLFFAIFVNFGLMGLGGIKVNLMTMVTTNIAIGVGVDYAIHYLYRLKILRESGLTNRDAVRETLNAVSRPVIMNAAATGLGFSVLMFSAFVSVGVMGFLIALAMLTTCVGAIILLPLINLKGGKR